ncbi:hypothetical protein Bbelb_113720 [Branchiostoma belcheri]|nr:hypothetical protein Bbelb_113720 [Branchiostoma belcheri]
MSGSRRTYRTLPLDVPHSPAERIALSRWTYRTLPQNVPHSPAGRTALSRRTYRTLPLDVPHSPAERIALSRRTSRTLPREVPHSVLHSPAERPSKIDAYFVACAVPTKTLEFILSKWNGFEQVLIELIQSNPTANQQEE